MATSRGIGTRFARTSAAGKVMLLAGGASLPILAGLWLWSDRTHEAAS
jgi:hypothetical protein